MRKLLIHAGLVTVSLVILVPLLWTLRISFVPEQMAYSTELMPQFTFQNYVDLFTQKRFGVYYVNSLIVATGSVLLALPFAAMTGYAFARFKTGGPLARFTVLATQMLPPVAIVLPAFMLFRSVGMTNSVLGLTIAYAAINLPFLIWILMGFSRVFLSTWNGRHRPMGPVHGEHSGASSCRFLCRVLPRQVCLASF